MQWTSRAILVLLSLTMIELSALPFAASAGASDYIGVGAGPDATRTMPEHGNLEVALEGYTWTDTPQIPPSTAWSFRSGPAAVTFSNPANPRTSVSISASGTYVLRLSALFPDLPTLPFADDMTLTVRSAEGSPSAQPPPPAQNAKFAQADLAGDWSGWWGSPAERMTFSIDPGGKITTGAVPSVHSTLSGRFTLTDAVSGTVSGALVFTSGGTLSFSANLALSSPGRGGAPFLLAGNATSPGGPAFSMEVSGGAQLVPQITSPPAATGMVGAQFFYEIQATRAPTSFQGAGLPEGLNLDTLTGVISGTPASPGSTVVDLTASNAAGTGTLRLTLTIRPFVYTIRASAGPGGTITPQGEIEVPPGANGSFQISPYFLHSIAAVIVDGNPVEASPTYTFSNVQGNHTLEARFAIQRPVSGVNHPPEIASLSPSQRLSAAIGQEIVFSAAATDPDGQAISYLWDFGDGVAATGASVPHSFPSSGIYDVSLEVSDGITAVRRGIMVVVHSGSSGISADLPVLAIDKVQGVLRYGPENRDVARLSGRVSNLQQGLALAGGQVTVYLAGSKTLFSLDPNGTGLNGDGSFSMQRLPDSQEGAGSSARFSIHLARGTWASEWEGHGLIPGSGKVEVRLPVGLMVNGLPIVAEVPVLFIRRGSTGRFRSK